MIKSDESQEENVQDGETDYRLAMLRSPLRQQGLLLDMLAEVASKTLFEPIPTMNISETTSNIPSIVNYHQDPVVEVTQPPPTPPPAKKKRVTRVRKSSQNDPSSLSHEEMSALPAHRLLKIFSRSDCNELRKTFSFSCIFEPDVCKETFTSFGSEARARKHILDHLKNHIHQLSLQGGKENSNEVKAETKVKTALPKLEEVKTTKEQVVTRTKTKAELTEGKGPVNAVSFDHCYAGLDLDSSVPSPIEYMEPVTVRLDCNSELTSFIASETFNIEFIDNSELPFVPVVGRVENVAAEEITLQPFEANLPEVQPQECVVETKQLIQEKTDVRSNKLETTPRTTKRKAKGKARFIGQSSSEKMLAISMIEQIKKKQLSPLDSLECRICEPPRTFTAPTTLLSHYRSHAGIKPYECRICRAAFTRQHSLNYHLLIHSNETRFTCRDCGRKFRHPSHFREHQRRHTGESPYECIRCSARFKTRNTYKRHLKTRHNQVLSPDGELVSTEPSPPSPDTYLHSPESTESDNSSQDCPESPDQNETLIVFPDTKRQKEDIAKQAMRSSNISFEDDIPTEHNNNFNHVKNISGACSLDTVLTFQYAAAVRETNPQVLDTVVDASKLVMMF